MNFVPCRSISVNSQTRHVLTCKVRENASDACNLGDVEVTLTFGVLANRRIWRNLGDVGEVDLLLLRAGEGHVFMGGHREVSSISSTSPKIREGAYFSSRFNPQPTSTSPKIQTVAAF